MSSTNENFFLNILKCCFSSANNVRILENSLEDGELHFTSSVTRVVVQYEQDGRTHQKKVVVKVPTSEALGAFFESVDFFNREVCMYEKVIPQLRKYMDQNILPTHLYATDSRILVLDDLIAYGYKSGEKLPPLDLNQTKAVLKAFANFHAASHKLHKEDPNYLRDLLAIHIPAVEFRKIAMKTWSLVVQQLLKDKNEHALLAKMQPIITFLEKEDEEVKRLINQSNFKFVVLNHGDSRKDNVMLKYGLQDRVECVQLIDFQACLWSSPLLDIFYFLVASVSLDVVEAHYNDLIEGYLKELNEKLRKLDCGSTYSRVNFDEDYESLSFFVFFCVLALSYFISPLDSKQKQQMFIDPAPNISLLCHLCFKNENWVESIYNWLKCCEKWQVFENFSKHMVVPKRKFHPVA